MNRQIWIRFGLPAFLILSSHMAAAQQNQAGGFDHAHAQWANFLIKYVAHDGATNQSYVRYAKLKEDPKALQAYLDEIAKVSSSTFSAWTAPQKLAFLINAYNAASIRLVLDVYPAKTIQDLPHGSWYSSPLSKGSLMVLGAQMSLHDIRKEIFAIDGTDSKALFALACPMKSCPPLRWEPYMADWVQQQTEDATSRFFAQATNARIEASGKLMLNGLLKKCWFPRYSHCAGGFMKSPESFALQYMKKEGERAIASPANAEGMSAEYMIVDSSLNDVPTGTQ